ncbi:MAG: hypothetical protein JWQ35_632, partial [Bacteriovoracaceae bacterium]|nr:hypothetical protein [Bacteriovoracaceae bacterium]
MQFRLGGVWHLRAFSYPHLLKTAGNHFKSIYMPSKNGEFGGFFKILNSVALE